MDEVEDIPNMDVRLAKRARLEDLDASQLNGSSHSTEVTVPASRPPALHTKALRSVLKGAPLLFVHLTDDC